MTDTQRTAQELAARLRNLADGVRMGHAPDTDLLARRMDAIAADIAALASQAEPTMSDAIAAGDGTLHGAIDYWQQRASEDGRDAARWPATKFQNLKPVGYASVVDIDRYELPFCVGTHLPGVRDVALYTRDQVLAAIAAKEQS